MAARTLTSSWSTAAALLLLAGCGGGTAAGAGAADTRAMSDEEVQQRVAEWDAPSRDEWQRPAEVVGLLEVQPGMTVVDLGAGTGYFLEHLSEAVGPGGRVIALEIEPALVAHMQERVRIEALQNVEVRQVERDDPGLGRGSVDRILAVDTWPYLESRSTYVHHLHAALRPGGRALVVDYTEDSLRGPPESQRLLPHHVVSELQHSGLTAEVVDASLPDQYVVLGTRGE